MSGEQSHATESLGATSHSALVSSLLDELTRAGVTEAEVAFGDLRIMLRRRPGRVTMMPAALAGAEPVQPLREGWVAVTAPLAGVFYNRETPDSEAFVHLGGMVHAGQTVGLIESMKMFNDVSCDINGLVREILVSNGELVQTAQVLLYVEPGEGIPEGPPAL